MTLAAVAGISAGTIDFVSFYPYIKSIIKGKTKPNRASFAIWAAVGTVILLSSFSAGARDTLWFVLSYTILGFIVLVCLSSMELVVLIVLI